MGNKFVIRNKEINLMKGNILPWSAYELASLLCSFFEMHPGVVDDEVVWCLNWLAKIESDSLNDDFNRMDPCYTNDCERASELIKAIYATGFISDDERVDALSTLFDIDKEVYCLNFYN